VCPHNDHIKPIKAPKYLNQIVADSVYTVKPLKDIIGVNYARPKYLTNMSIVYSANTKNFDSIDRIKQLSKEEQFTQMATWALNELSKKAEC
jgi:hypothetical protein